MTPSLPLRLSAPADRLSVSHHSGPGLRAIVWVQGCSVHCTKNCLNPHLLTASGGVLTTTDALCEAVLRVGRSYDELEGITVLGGEPFDQAEPVAVVLSALRTRSLSTMVYSGHTLEELVEQHDRSIDALLQVTDILVDGPFIDALHDPALIWRGSSNQRLLTLSTRYSEHDLQQALDAQKRSAFLSIRPLHDAIASGAQSMAVAKQMRRAVRRRSTP